MGTRGVLDTIDHLVFRCDKDDRRPIVERKREVSEVSEFRGVKQGRTLMTGCQNL